jgi:5-methylcytosine-specific restriction protein A
MKKPDPFYLSSAWRKCRAQVLQRDDYLCQICLSQGMITAADLVHHIEHLQDRPDKALDMYNLQSVCHACHNKLHPEKVSRGKANAIDKRKKKVRIIQTKSNPNIW